MTFNVGHVEGGTGAGRKRPLRDKPKPWVHVCASANGGSHLPGYLTRCPVCKQERP